MGKDKKESLIFIFEIWLMLEICYLHSLNAGHYADFYPINGTFQNFNPARRLLSGQIPYRDFQDYLGLGHLYTGTIMTLILGGDYQGSLVAFSFLSIAGLAFLSIMIGIALFSMEKTFLQRMRLPRRLYLILFNHLERTISYMYLEITSAVIILRHLKKGILDMRQR